MLDFVYQSLISEEKNKINKIPSVIPQLVTVSTFLPSFIEIHSLVFDKVSFLISRTRQKRIQRKTPEKT